MIGGVRSSPPPISRVIENSEMIKIGPIYNSGQSYQSKYYAVDTVGYDRRWSRGYSGYAVGVYQKLH